METYSTVQLKKAFRATEDWVFIKDVNKEVIHDIFENFNENSDITYIVKKLINIIDNTYSNRLTVYIDDYDRDILLYFANELAEHVDLMDSYYAENSYYTNDLEKFDDNTIINEYSSFIYSCPINFMYFYANSTKMLPICQYCDNVEYEKVRNYIKKFIV